MALQLAGGRRAPGLLCAAACAALALPTLAQDALRGKRLYLDAARLTGSGVSCVDCHGGLPGGLFGIGRAANDPAAVERAVNAIPQMTPLRGRLKAQDYADLAAYIGNPAVPSPALRSTATGPGVATTDRVDFGAIAVGSVSAAARWALVNDGAVPLMLLSAPTLRGEHPEDFAVVASDCRAGQLLAGGGACSTELVFRPSAEAGARHAAVVISHDWVGGEVALALGGRAHAPAAPPAPAPSAAQPPTGGGGAVSGVLLLGLLALRFLQCQSAESRTPHDSLASGSRRCQSASWRQRYRAPMSLR